MTDTCVSSVHHVPITACCNVYFDSEFVSIVKLFQPNWLQSFKVRHAQFVLQHSIFFIHFLFINGFLFFLYSFQCLFITTYATVFLVSPFQRMIMNCLFSTHCTFMWTVSFGFFPVILQQSQLLNKCLYFTKKKEQRYIEESDAWHGEI